MLGEMTRYLLKMRSRAEVETRMHLLPLDKPLYSCGLHTLPMNSESGFGFLEMSKERPPEPLDFFIWTVEDVGLWLEEINLGGYRQTFKENGVNGEYLEVACLKGEQKVRRPWWAPSCLSIVFVRVAKRNRQSRVVSMKLEP
ncbi:sterile alpha motif domain-containing protein [Tanacetum coccineum]